MLLLVDMRVCVRVGHHLPNCRSACKLVYLTGVLSWHVFGPWYGRPCHLMRDWLTASNCMVQRKMVAWPVHLCH